MALPEIKYTKVKTSLCTELAVSVVVFDEQAVQMKSYSDVSRSFQRRGLGEATAAQAGF